MTRFGLSLPAGGRSSPAPGARSLADAAQRIEAAGFESIWAFDAIGRGWLMADPLTAKARTFALALGSQLVIAPLTILNAATRFRDCPPIVVNSPAT